MVDVWLPYGKSDVCVRIPARNLLGSIEPRQVAGAEDVKAEIKRALNNPIGSKRLSEIAQAEHKVAIVVDDFTRNTPSHAMLPPVLVSLVLQASKMKTSPSYLAVAPTGQLNPKKRRGWLARKLLAA